MSGRTAIVVKGYPRLSETFIAQEIRGLEERGLDIEIVSLRHPTDKYTHPVHDEITAPVRYLPEYLYQEPRRVWRAWRAVRKLPGYKAVRQIWMRDLCRDRTPNRIRRFGQALVLAHELGTDVDHIHVHFLHTPASVARYAAALTGRSWTVSAHAKDIWTSPEWEKREKLADADWLVTCSAYARDHLAALDDSGGKVELVYHGLDGDRFPPGPERKPLRDGSDPADPLRILCVGRAVEKKGHDILLDALSRCARGIAGGPGCQPVRRSRCQARPGLPAGPAPRFRRQESVRGSPTHWWQYRPVPGFAPPSARSADRPCRHRCRCGWRGRTNRPRGIGP
jgi:glycosyltransferase involved in cell wall biosynthesis